MGAIGIFGMTFWLPGGLVVKIDVCSETTDTTAAAAICAADQGFAQLAALAAEDAEVRAALDKAHARGPQG